MKIFKLDDTYQIVCQSLNTRNGFKHVATLLRNNYNVDETKICYINRTWERFQYESVIKKLLEKYFEKEECEKYKCIIMQNNV